MINDSSINIKKYKPKELLTYFIIIIGNSNIISQDYIIDWNMLNKTIKIWLKDFLINAKNYDINIKNINNEYIFSEKIIPWYNYGKIFLL